MYRSGLMAALALAVTAGAQAQGSSGPMIRSGATEQISDHVYVIPDASVPGVPNVGFVVGDDATLVIDTGMGVENGETVLAEARKLSADNKLYIISTHYHPEHDLGAPAFPDDAVMLRSEDQLAEIKGEGMRVADVFRSRSAVNRRLLTDASFRDADQTFADSLELDLGGVSVEVRAAGPGHTIGDTIAIVASENVLFAGDLAMKPLPVFASSQSNIPTWLETLDELEALGPEIIVPAHGPMGGPEYISGYRSFMIRVRARVGELKAEGKSLEETSAAMSEELADTYTAGEIRRAGSAIRNAYALAEG